MTKYAIGDRVVYENVAYEVIGTVIGIDNSNKNIAIKWDDGDISLDEYCDLKTYVEPLKKPSIPEHVPHYNGDSLSFEEFKKSYNCLIDCIAYLYERLEKGQTK